MVYKREGVVCESYFTGEFVDRQDIIIDGRMLTIDRLSIFLVFTSQLHYILASFNVALRKPTWQSSTDFNSSSLRAVDGITNQVWSAGSCAHSDTIQREQWWCVDLNQVLEITSMKILNRADGGFEDRLTGFEIRLSSTGHCDGAGFTSATPCYKDHTSVGLSTYTIERCNLAAVPSFSGRFVFISVKGRPAILTLCEVQIFPENCPGGFYGTNCNQRCSTNCSNNACDARTRKCTGCKVGYYGDVCEESCSTCNGTCRQLDGVCLIGCKDGYWGWNGLCLQPCSYCTTGGCRIEDGVCHNGCKVGVNNTKC